MSVPTEMSEDLEEGAVVKKVIGNLRSFLQNNLSIDEDFILDLQAKRLLNETDASRLRVSLSKGGSEALYSLLDHVASHYDQEMLEELCSFLEDYSERKIRPRLRRIAQKIRNEMKRLVQWICECFGTCWVPFCTENTILQSFTIDPYYILKAVTLLSQIGETLF